jgi:trk system potassium uptake protein TrkA
MRVLVAGGGQVGFLVAQRLIREGNEVTLVESGHERCLELEAQLDAKVVEGSAARVGALRRAGIADAEMVIAVTDSDEVNVLCCLIAQVESKARVKVARIRTHEVEEWRRITAASGVRIDLMIHPESAIAERIMRVIRVPGVSDVVDFADGRVQMFGMNIEAGSWLVGKTLEELDRNGPPADSLVALIFRGQQVIVPHGSEVLREGDHVYVVAARECFSEAVRFMGLREQGAVERVFIVGGKQIGITCAEMLEKQGVDVKFFEPDPRRAAKIAEILERTIVLRADGTDQKVLEDENIDGVDAFLALTSHDEDNIIAALLARRLGVRKVVALINRPNYLPMAQRLGVNTTVSPRQVTVDRILQFVRRGRVLSVTTFREEEAEAIELIASERSKYVGKRLRDVRLPREVIVGAIVRPDGQVRVPRGDEEIRAGDRVIFFTLESVVSKLEAAFLAEQGRVQP